MNLPWVYTCSPSWTPLPHPSLYHPSGSSQCTSPKHPVSCIEPGQALILNFFNLFSILPSEFFFNKCQSVYDLTTQNYLKASPGWYKCPCLHIWTPFYPSVPNPSYSPEPPVLDAWSTCNSMQSIHTLLLQPVPAINSLGTLRSCPEYYLLSYKETQSTLPLAPLTVHASLGTPYTTMAYIKYLHIVQNILFSCFLLTQNAILLFILQKEQTVRK